MDYVTWKNTVNSKVPAFIQSGEIKNITDVYFMYEKNKGENNRKAFKDAIVAWKNAAKCTSEVNAIGNAAITQLEAIANGPISAPGIAGQRAVGVPIGYRLIRYGDNNWALDVGDSVRALNSHPPAMTAAQVNILNETMRRCKAAVNLACDGLNQIIRSKNGPSVPADLAQRYLEIFGAWDSVRATTVQTNFNTIKSALANPILQDYRQTDFFDGIGDGYAACTPGKVIMNLKIYIGYDIFDQWGKSKMSTLDEAMGVYTESTDATVGTIIHEVSHGSCKTIDPPKVNNAKNGWMLAPKPDGSSPDNNQQASGKEQVKRVASFAPDIAIKAADNYGVFASECLAASKQ